MGLGVDLELNGLYYSGVEIQIQLFYSHSFFGGVMKRLILHTTLNPTGKTPRCQGRYPN